MHTVRMLVLALAAGAAAHADFSYTMSRKTSGPMAGGDQATKYYLKGQKMMIDLGMTAVIMDFDAQTFTNVNKSQKTYSVTPFSQAGAAGQGTPAPDIQMDFKETGEHKNINGFDATQTIINVQAEMPQAQGGMKMSMEMELWVSPDVPGAEELHGFYQRNGSKFPWGALASGNNPNSKAMLEMQRKLTTMKGVPVLEIMRMKPAGGAAAPQMPSMTPQQQAQMAQARARLEAMAAQGGPAGDAAKQALARMGAATGGGGAGGSMFEITMEASGFSTGSIPGEVFAVPAGFSKVEK